MSQRFRRGFTAAEKTELWERWQRGGTQSERRSKSSDNRSEQFADTGGESHR